MVASCPCLWKWRCLQFHDIKNFNQNPIDTNLPMWANRVALQGVRQGEPIEGFLSLLLRPLSIWVREKAEISLRNFIQGHGAWRLTFSESASPGQCRRANRHSPRSRCVGLSDRLDPSSDRQRSGRAWSASGPSPWFLLLTQQSNKNNKRC